MTTQPETTLPRQITPALFTKKTAFDVSRMAATTAPAPSAPVIGQRMADGTVYAGVSPDTGTPMYTTPRDTGLCASWYRAMDYATKARDLGHSDWRVPTWAELNQLFRHRAAIGNFDETGHIDRGWYWSSSRGNEYDAWMQRFSDGRRSLNDKYLTLSLRCVRG